MRAMCPRAWSCCQGAIFPVSMALKTWCSVLLGVQAAISNGSQATFQIRGMGAVDHQALTPSAAAVHVDGVFLATNVQASLLAYDLDRVEVLKGPQGTIQGRNASSGSVNFITARPTDAFEATPSCPMAVSIAGMCRPPPADR
jgi:outer membrane receptor for ferric coprogen and ferric-rhodotorulic acid